MNYQDVERQSTLLADGLDEIATLVGDKLGLAEEATKLNRRARQVRDDRFRVLVVGEFKRGKSTLLNALLGDDILPRKVTPCTAVVTVIQYGELPGVRVVFDDRRPDEELTVADFRKRYELNLEDAGDRAAAMDRFSRVDYAALSYPVELCRHRIELVDSPGLGEHQSRSQRTQKFLPQADAVVFVLHATQFLKEDESHFLEAVLLPMGLRNVFFVINGWNLIDDSALRPEDADRDRAELESHIRQRLTPFCVIHGRDRSAERIFRVNALGALQARMRRPPPAAKLEESNVPAFEAALQRFLVEDRAKARADVLLGALQTTAREVDRYIATQLAMADKSVAEIEAERAALQPKLDRLRGIRQHIVGFLQVTSSNLQDRLAVSFQNHIKRVEADLPTEVAKFDLGPITKRWLTWAALTDWARADENKFASQAKACIEPQIQKLLERRFAQWQQSVVKNEMEAVSIDVDKHLQEEAAEYQRVMREIEERIGIHASPMQVQEMVKRWLQSGSPASAGHIDLPAMSAMGDLGWLLGGIVAEVIAEAVLHVWTGGLTLIVGGLISLFRMGWREAALHGQIQDTLIKGIQTGLHDVSQSQAAEIRAGVRKGFDGLEEKVSGRIDEEVGLIDASLTAIIERKKEKEYSAEQEREKLTSARGSIDRITTHLSGILS